MSTRSNKPDPTTVPRKPRARGTRGTSKSAIAPSSSATDSDRPIAPARSAIEELRGDLMQIKRERILQEAAALFYERGYMQTTMDAIAERMGATKPFVYYHFESKAEMLTEICQRAITQALEATDRALRVDGSPLQKFDAFVRDFTRVALVNHTFVAIYFREEFALPTEAREHINRMRKSLDRKLRGLLEEGAAHGDFELQDPGITALVVAGMASYAFAWYREGSRIDREGVVDQIARMALKTVAPSSAG